MSARILAMDPMDRDRSGQRRPTRDSDITISIDIAEWLRGLGLEQYAPAFAENAIDWKVLPKLTSDDFREIGVAAVGHRRKLLEAIAILSEAARPGAAEPPSAASSAMSRNILGLRRKKSRPATFGHCRLSSCFMPGLLSPRR
jgi:SAM domain (Sterile alpha motif)